MQLEHIAALRYRRDIDGLRAVAVLSVLGFHAFPSAVPGGFIGVDIFFVISGYLISLILLTELERGNFSYVGFYVRRIRRIFPGLLLVLTACYGIGWHVLFADEFRQLGKHIAGGAGFVSNLVLWAESGYFDSAAISKPLLHVWSLGIEEQFYLIWPLILAGAWRNRKQVRGILLFLLAASFALNLATLNDADSAFYSPLSRLWELLVGALLAHFRVEQANFANALEDKYGDWLSIGGGALILAGLAIVNKEQVLHSGWMILPAFGAAFVIAAGDRARLNRLFLSNPLMVWIGLISFPLYLWHWPLLSYANILAGSAPGLIMTVGMVVLAFVLAAITYLVVENPLRFGAHGPRKAMVLLAGMALAGCAGYATYSLDGFGKRTIVTLGGRRIPADNIQDGQGNNRDCPAGKDLHPDFIMNCTLHINPRAKTRIVVWGDSHAGSWQPAFEQIARRNDLELYVVTQGGCPPLDGVYGPGPRSACKSADATRNVMNSIIALRPDRLFLAARWGMYYATRIEGSEWQPRHFFVTTEINGPATDQTSRKALQERLPATIARFRSVGIDPVVIESVPVLKGVAATWRKAPEELATTIAEHRQINGFSRSVIQQIPDLTVYDPALKMCGAVCRASIGGKMMYSDDSHLTPQGALFFEQELARLVPVLR